MPTDHRPAPDRRAIWLGLLTLYFVWGSTYLAIAVAVDTIPPFVMAAIRFVIAGLVLLGWSMARGRGTSILPSRREWRDSAIVGALLLGGGMGMVAWSEQTIPSGITALLVAMMPVWVAIFGRLFFRERLPAIAVAGILLGFGGVAILVAPTISGGTGALDPAGLLAVFVAPLCWSIGSLFASHRATLPRRPLVNTGAQMLTGGIVLAFMGAATGEFARFDVTAISSDSFLALLYLTVVGSLLAFSAFGWLLQVAPLPFVATYAYVNPVVAVALGAIVLGETIDVRTVLAGGVIVAAVALIVTARGRMSSPRARSAVARAGPATNAPVAVPSTASTIDRPV